MISTEAVEETEVTPLTRELNVLSSLAHFGWLNTQHLHALCFHGMAVATVRTTLRYFEEAGWVRHVRWRLGSPDGGHVWAIQFKGIRLLEQYLPVVPQIVSDLSRPTSALEQEEWRIQVTVRNFVTRFVLEARQRPLIATASLSVPSRTWQHALAAPRITPDAILSLVWERPKIQLSSWLPWTDSAPPGGRPTQFALYCDRTATISHLSWFIHTVTADVQDKPRIAVLVLGSAERQAAAQDTMRQLGRQPACRIATWAELEHGLFSCHGQAAVVQPTL